VKLVGSTELLFNSVRDQTSALADKMEGALSAVIGKIADFFNLLLPSFELSLSPAFWVYIFWGLW
jgi:hypothetical protein